MYLPLMLAPGRGKNGCRKGRGIVKDVFLSIENVLVVEPPSSSSDQFIRVLGTVSAL